MTRHARSLHHHFAIAAGGHVEFAAQVRFDALVQESAADGGLRGAFGHGELVFWKLKISRPERGAILGVAAGFP